MTDPASERAVRLLLEEVERANGNRDHTRALTAAEHAVQAALALDDLGLVIAAIAAEATTLRALGDDGTALARYATIVSLAQAPRTRTADPEQIAREVCRAYLDLVVCARSGSDDPGQDILDVLDAAEQWLEVTGRREWRAGFLLQRAEVLRDRGDLAAALRCAEESLTAFAPGAPGFSRNHHRSTLADLFLRAGRHRRAEALYRTMLDDPEASTGAVHDAHFGLAACGLRNKLVPVTPITGSSAIRKPGGRRDLGDPFAARQHAEAALAISTAAGDEENMCRDLEALATAARLGGDLAAARAANDRYFVVAGRIGGSYWPYFAARSILQLALAEGDGGTARAMLPVLAHHAAHRDDHEALAREVARFAERAAALP